jgi:hypothetical protein
MRAVYLIMYKALGVMKNRYERLIDGILKTKIRILV